MIFETARIITEGQGVRMGILQEFFAVFCFCLFKRSIALGLGVGLGLGIGLGFVLGLGLGVGLALGLGWVRHYMLRSESARIKPSFSRRIPKKNKRRQKILENFQGREQRSLRTIFASRQHL